MKARKRMHKRASSTDLSARLACMLALAAALAGCSAWKLGPEPDNYVGPGSGPAQRITDPGLEAVVPVVPGDRAGGGVPLPGATGSAATVPATVPLATQLAAPATATAPSLAPAATSRGVLPESLSV